METELIAATTVIGATTGTMQDGGMTAPVATGARSTGRSAMTRGDELAGDPAW